MNRDLPDLMDNQVNPDLKARVDRMAKEDHKENVVNQANLEPQVQMEDPDHKDHEVNLDLPAQADKQEHKVPEEKEESLDCR